MLLLSLRSCLYPTVMSTAARSAEAAGFVADATLSTSTLSQAACMAWLPEVSTSVS